MPRAGAGEWLFPFALVAVLLLPRRTPVTIRPFALPLVLLGFAPAVLLSIDPLASAVQLGVLLYVATILMIAREAALRGEGAWVLGGFTVGALSSSAVGFLAPQVDPWLVAGWPRPLGFTESPNMLATQACTGALAAYVLRQRVSSSLGRVSLLTTMFALGATALATLGHVVFAAIVAVFAAPAIFTKGRVRSFALAGATGSAALLLASTRVRLLPLASHFPFFDRRPNLYAAAHAVDIDVFRSHPFTGVGLECFSKTWRAYDDGLRFTANFAGGQEHFVGVPLDTHSTWLGYPAEGGLFGVLVLAGITWLALRARKNAAPELTILLVFAAGVGFFADVLTSREIALVAGVLSVGSVVAPERA